MPQRYQGGAHPRMARRHRHWHDSLMAIMEPAIENPATAQINVGQRLRELRAKRNLSIRSLAELSGLNFNTLSLIENGKTSPSVSTLQQLSTALDVHITAFFETVPVQKEVAYQKSGQRPMAKLARGIFEDLGSGLTLGDDLPLLITLEPGAESGDQAIVHTGQEFDYCLEGRMTYWVDRQDYTLDAGDSLIFQAYLPHRWGNKNRTTSRSLLILCPSDERDFSAGQHFIPEEETEYSENMSIIDS